MAQLKDLEYYLAQARRIAEHREAGAEKEIRKLYKELLQDLQQFMSQTYIQYAQNDQLTYAMLQEKGYNARFLEEIEQRLKISTPKAAQVVRQLVEDTYTAAYHSMVDGVAKVYHDPANNSLESVFSDSLAITPEQIKVAVENPVSGLTLSDTLDKNRVDIIYNIKKIVGVGLMNGDRYTTMAKRIAEQVDGDYKKAIRIARTETHRVREAGELDAALKVDKELQNGTTGMRMVKKWKTMKDEKVRPQYMRKRKKGGWTKGIRKNGANHVKMDGQTVLITEPFDLLDGNKAMAPSQSGVAAHDINCRCIAVKVMMTDEEYFAATGKHFPAASIPETAAHDPLFFTDEQKEAIEWYVSGEGQYVNQYYRGRVGSDFGDLSDDEKFLVSKLDEATDRLLADDITALYRSVDAKAIFGDIDYDDWYYIEQTILYGDAYSAKKVGALINRTQGKTITEKGFMSTTKRLDVAEEWGDFTGSSMPITLEFESIPKGLNGADLKQFDVEGNEQFEVLLARGARYKIENIYAKNGQVHVKAQFITDHK